MAQNPPSGGDLFRDRLEEVAAGAPKRDLSQQSRPTQLSAQENALADALMEIYGSGEHDFSAVAAALSAAGIAAPASGRKDWDTSLLETELGALNAAMDAAYAEDGYGA